MSYEPKKMPLANAVIAQLFTDAHTQYAWQSRRIDDTTLRQLYDISRWAPTSTNGSPARFVFVTSDEGKRRIKPALFGSNVDRAMAAPLVVIVAWDPHFYNHLTTLFPAKPDAAKMYQENSDLAHETAFRNSTLQGAYLLMAARALGLDCGPVSGFNHKKVDDEFFSENGFRSNFLINVGYAAPNSSRPRGPRFAFEEVVQLC